MSWENNLLEASFRGLTFDCLSTDDSVNRAVAVHSTPYQDGDDLEDMGAESDAIRISAIFYGDDFDIRLQAFLAKLAESGAGELVHPVFGVQDVQLLSHQVRQEAESIDTAFVTLQFKRVKANQPLFHQTLTLQKAESITQFISQNREVAAAVLTQTLAPVVEGEDVTRQQQIRFNMLDALNQVKAKVDGHIDSGLDPIKNARAWLGDLAAGMSGLIDLRDFNPLGILADIKAVFASLDDLILVPSLPRQSPDDVAIINHQFLLEQANTKAEAISVVLASEAETPTLSAPDIEALVNAVREDFQAVITQSRELYPLEQAHPLNDAIKTTALTVQQAAQSIIELRPPLIGRQVTDRANYRLLAHQFYGDHTRADELWRLNPQAKYPNQLHQGDQVNAYAE